MKLHDKLLEIQKLHLKYPKKAENPFFHSKYLSLDDLLEKAQPELDARDLGILHYCKDKELVTRLFSGDDMIESSFPLPDADPQKIGSAITYGKRNNLGALLNVVTDDDDDGDRQPVGGAQRVDAGKIHHAELHVIVGGGSTG